MQSSARVADSMSDSRETRPATGPMVVPACMESARAACARPRMASAFQLVRTFSSRVGQIRALRIASSFARAVFSRREASAISTPRL